MPDRHQTDYYKWDQVEQVVPDRLAHNTLAMLRDYDLAHPPIDGDDLADVLPRLAALFGVGVPERQGTELYAIALSSLPKALLMPAVIRVAARHKYPTLPLPADLLAVVEDEIKTMRRERNRLANAYRKVRGVLMDRMITAAEVEKENPDPGRSWSRIRVIEDPEKVAEIEAFKAETEANVGRMWVDPDAVKEPMTI